MGKQTARVSKTVKRQAAQEIAEAVARECGMEDIALELKRLQVDLRALSAQVRELVRSNTRR